MHEIENLSYEAKGQNDTMIQLIQLHLQLQLQLYNYNWCMYNAAIE